MPIRGLTDRGATFPEIGRIRKGAQKGEKKPGKDLTYFRVVFDEHETESEERFAREYPEEPRSLNVWLPFDHIEDMWDAWVEAYVAGGLVHRSDGKWVEYHVNPLTGEREVLNGYDRDGNRVECPSRYGKPVAHYIGRNGKEKELMAAPIGRLKVIIIELHRFAYLTLITTSQYDIGNISSHLEAIKSVSGKLSGIPFLVQRKPNMVSVPMDDGKRVRQEKWLISIEIHPDWADAKLQAMAQAALPRPGIVEGYLIEPPGMDSEQDGEWEPGFDPPTQPHPPIDQEMSQVPPGTTGAFGVAGSVESPGDDTVTRPYQPKVVREKLQQWIEHYKGTRKDEARGKMELWQYVRWQLAECFEGDPGTDAKVHTVSVFLTGKDSSKKWTGAEARAIEKWLDPQTVYPSEDLKPSRMAVQEAQLIVRARMMELGQQALLDGMETEEE